MQMHRVLSRARGMIPREHPGFEAALEAERDLQVLAFVFEQSAMLAADTEFRRLVKNALKDSLLPQDDRSGSRGRDAQFELFVAAVCQSAGMVPIAREEPDVTCTVEGVKFGIAAKRVKNVARIERHVRKAADQIEKAGLPGVIALDTCVALNRDNVRIATPIPDDQFGLLYKAALRHFIDGRHDRIQEWVRGKGVRGLVIHDQQVRFQTDGEWSLAGMTTTVSTARHNSRRQCEFAKFEEQYVKGLPNLEPC